MNYNYNSFNDQVKNERINSLPHQKMHPQKSMENLGYNKDVLGVEYHLPHKNQYYTNGFPYK